MCANRSVKVELQWSSTNRGCSTASARGGRPTDASDFSSPGKERKSEETSAVGTATAAEATGAAEVKDEEKQLETD